jgi:hypothetical protein
VSIHRCVIVSTAVLLVPLSVAVMVALALLYTRDVLTVNVAELAPAGTVTLLGTVATDVLLLDRLTAVAELAAAVNITVP